MTDPIKRALRTAIQAFLGTFAVLAIPALNSVITSAGDANGIVRIDLNLLGNAAIAGILAGVIALVSWAQNALEESTGKPVVPK